MISHIETTVYDGVTRDTVLKLSGTGRVKITSGAFDTSSGATFSVWAYSSAESVDVTGTAMGQAFTQNIPLRTWTRISVTVSNPTLNGSSQGEIYIGRSKTTTDLYLYMAQVEIGKRMSDWKSAIEDTATVQDIQNAINQYNIDTVKPLIDTVDGVTVTFFGKDTPTNATKDDVWYNPNTNLVEKYDGKNWVVLEGTDLPALLRMIGTAKATADNKIVTYAQDDQPSGGEVGDLWIETNNDNKIYRYNGIKWIPMRDLGIEVANNNANTALNEIKNLDIGGTNLLSDTLVPSTYSGNGISMELEEDGWIHVIGAPTISAGYVMYGRSANGLYAMPVWKAGTTYTMTVFFDGDCWFPKGNKDISVRIGGMSTSDIWYDTENYSYTFTPSSDITTGAVVLYPREGALNRAINGRIKVQIEEGNRPTAWTPNIYDTIMQGGRNFLRKTGSLIDWYHPNIPDSCFSGSYAMLPSDSSRSGNNYVRDQGELLYSDVKEREIVVSFEAKAESAITAADFLLIRLQRSVTPTGATTRYYPLPYIRGVFLTTEWTRYTRRFKINDSSFTETTSYSGLNDDIYCRLAFANCSASNIHLRNIKMEAGRVASDFSVAPEDISDDANLYTDETVSSRLKALTIGGYNLIPNSDRMPISTTGKVWNVQSYYLERVRINSKDLYDGTSCVVFAENTGDALVWSNFTINSGYKLSELKGKTVIITFDAKAPSNGTETGSVSYPQVVPTLFDSTMEYAQTTSRTAATNNTYLRRIRDNAQTPTLTSTWERFKIVLPEISLSMFTNSYNGKTKSENDLFGLTVFRYNMKGAEFRKFKMEISDTNPTEWSTRPSDIIQSDVNIASETALTALEDTTTNVYGAYEGDGWIHFKCTPTLTVNNAVALYTYAPSTSKCNVLPPMKAGQQYCVSVEYEGDCWGNNMYVYCSDIKTSDEKIVTSIVTTTQAGNKYFVITPTADTPRFQINVMIRSAMNGVAIDGRVRVKVTEGNQYSVWTPNPSDINTSGGENLLRNTSDLLSWSSKNIPEINFSGSEVMIPHTTAASGDYYINCIPRTIPYEDIVGKEIVLSFEAKCEGDPTGTNRLEARITVSDTDNGTTRKYVIYRCRRPLITDKWKRFYKCFKITDDILTTPSATDNDMKYVGVIFYNFTISNMYIRNIKLEYGRVPSSYSLSGQDAFEEIDEVRDIAESAEALAEAWGETLTQNMTFDTTEGILMHAYIVNPATGQPVDSNWYTKTNNTGFYIMNETQPDKPVGAFYEDKFEPSSMQIGTIRVRSTGTGWAFTAEE